MKDLINRMMELGDSLDEGLDDIKVDGIVYMLKKGKHTEARILGSKNLGLSRLAKQYKLIGELQSIDGVLAPSLEKYRKALDKKMLADAKKVLDKEVLDKLKGAL